MKYRTGLISVLTLIIAPAACADHHESSGPQPAWEIVEGISAPESAYFDQETGYVFVSQIGEGGGKRKDGDGWISKLTPDGKMLKNKWVTGFNAPKGLRSHQGTLWVCDIDRLMGVDIAQGKITHEMDVPGAKFLNDLACGLDGAVYMADTLGSKIYRYHDGDVTVFVEGPEYEAPNGLLVDGNRPLVAAWGMGVKDDFSTEQPGRLYALDLKTKKKTLITQQPIGNLDGIELDGQGGYVATGWVAGKVLHIDANGNFRVLLQLPKGAADLAFLPDRNLVIIPQMLESKLSAYTLSL